MALGEIAVLGGGTVQSLWQGTYHSPATGSVCGPLSLKSMKNFLRPRRFKYEAWDGIHTTPSPADCFWRFARH